MTMNRATFFNEIRSHFGPFKQSQVDGFTAVLDAWDGSGLTDTRWLAYMLGTTWHETAETVEPVREAFWETEAWRKSHLRYYPYYGRGYVQLTWGYNYLKLSAIVGEDLHSNPDLALRPDIAAKVMIHGMTDGLFTRHKLADYFHDGVADWVGSRRIINGLDRANLVAGYSQAFNSAIVAAIAG